MTKKLIFVYGTLRLGEGLNPYMQNFKFLGYAKIKGYDMYTNGGFPMIVKGEGEVVGEVYQIEGGENEIAVLDRIESAYTRTKIMAEWEGYEIEVEAYVYNSDGYGLQKINSGDWMVLNE